MNQSGLKNMVVLKNLPSNIVEEAILILKANSKIMQNEKIENKKTAGNDTVKNNIENEYILIEAEMLISNYITRIEKRKKEKNEIQKKIDFKCKNLKRVVMVMGIIILIETVVLLIR